MDPKQASSSTLHSNTSTLPFQNDATFAWDQEAAVHQLLLHLPPRSTAEKLCLEFLNRRQIAYRFTTLSADELWNEYLIPIYAALEQHDQNLATPEKLAVFFTCLSLGTVSETFFFPSSPEMALYIRVADIALTLCPILESPTPISLTAVILSAIYQIAAGGESERPSEGMDASWCLLSTAVKMAQSLGLRETAHAIHRVPD